MRASLTTLCTLGLALPLLAQTITMPPNLATTEGASSFHVPQYNPSRFQTIYGSKLTPNAPMIIKGFKFRPNGTSSSGVAHTYELTVQMSNQTIEPLTGYGIRWKANHGPDLMTTAAKVKVNFPAWTGTASPQPFTANVPFTTPFPFKGKVIVLDVETHKDATATYVNSWYVDAVLATGTNTVDYGKAARGGKGCPYDANVAANRFGVSGYLAHKNGPFYQYGNCQAKNVKLPGVNLIGISDTVWGPVTLPFDLTALGGPGCSLYTDVVLTFASATDPTSAVGYILFDMGTVPNLASLVGAVFTSQMAVVDPTYNTLGLRMSDYIKWTVGKGLEGVIDGFTFYAYQSSATGRTVDPVFTTYSYKYVPVVEIY